MADIGLWVGTWGPSLLGLLPAGRDRLAVQTRFAEDACWAGVGPAGVWGQLRGTWLLA